MFMDFFRKVIFSFAFLILSNPLSDVFAETSKVVTYDNYSYVESTMQMDRYQALAKGVNQWLHFRSPTPIDNQPTIRMNRDTLYSFALVNVKDNAVIILPDSGKRYMSLMLVNEDGYTNKVWYGKGRYLLTPEIVGSDYALVVIRILVNANNSEDVKIVNILQNKLRIEAKNNSLFTVHPWNKSSYEPIYHSLLGLFKLLPNTVDTFGQENEVDPVRFLLGVAAGYGGLPTKDAYYINVSPNLPIGSYKMTLKDVPVDGFWSVSLYNKNGYFFSSKYGENNINNLTATPSSDGSYTLFFGDCSKQKENCLALEDGWNFVVRLYKPKESILSGEWNLPKLETVTP